jgi:hypothetical protein
VKPVSAEAVSLALGYAKVAPSDIKAALVLYRYELYPQACYFLQQGVEKSSKAFALLIGTMKPEEAQKKVSHDSLKSLVLHLPEVVDSAKKELADLLKWLREQPPPQGVLTRLIVSYLIRTQLGLEQIASILEQLNIESVEWPRIDSVFEGAMWQATLNLDSLRPEVASMLSALKRIDDVEPLLVRASFQILFLVLGAVHAQKLMYLLHMYRASWRVTPLSGLTMWHEEATRYQTEYGGPSDYVSTKPLIMKFRTLAKHAEVLSKEMESASSFIARERSEQRLIPTPLSHHIGILPSKACTV